MVDAQGEGGVSSFRGSIRELLMGIMRVELLWGNFGGLMLWGSMPWG